MKPRIFIGSSVESLSVAHALQESLDYDAEVTVWTQGVFKLSSNTLVDLTKKLNEVDFAIFVFNPDDVTIVREQKQPTVRDNVIFELGLFIGKLGKENVFYIIPRDQELHLPTDLLGVLPGSYDPKRTDGNLLAAVGPFANQVRALLKNFRYTNLKELQDEPEIVRHLALEKPDNFEYLILAEMIEFRLQQSKKLFNQLTSGSYFVKSRLVDDKAYFEFYEETLKDFENITHVFSNLLLKSLPEALGPNGTPSNFQDLKEFAGQLSALCLELFYWELKNQEFNPPPKLSQIKNEMLGVSKFLSDNIYKLPSEIKRVIDCKKIDPNSEARIDIVLNFPEGMRNAMDIFQRYFHNKNNGY